ncbi:type IV pilus twitching motility protein PilT [Deinococcus peraridilitoris]|uniref:Pilus retraction protein PilT n=1 Tax=Deinococcus peraridilitoris (strain DSM 19664 / LMG 22246 / CIP 109416 / KR-200) TaxID=937777 RepID=L0A3R9_DEIPD|nr:type IV pilus twitching motility protein PilT [Deinococcus peraridilitoris]AFZ67640.1 pilus retraction protein PilT [Deinococcus peraridilitoris DSM 19664]
MPTSTDITDILRLAAERGASDVIVTAGLPPQFKVHGDYTGFDFEPLEATDTRKLMYSMMNEKQQRTFEEKRELDFSFSLGDRARFRVNAFQQRGAVGGVLRLIPTKIKSVQELGLPATCVEIANAPRGLVLVTGPTGSGKSTTLAAMIDHINVTKRMHIMTIEDPIEFLHPHKNSIINQREIGSDSWGFDNALRAVLRQAPDVILVGEMRDYETIKAAVTAAETGHLVMGTLHTNSAPESIDRIVDVFPEEQQAQIRVQLANNLVAVMTQQLLPRSDREGRIMAYEILVATPAVRALIREGKTYQITSVMQTGAQLGMQTMDSYLAGLYRRRVISYDVGLERAVDPKEFARLATDAAGSGAPGKPAPAPAPQPASGSTQFGRR